ncbi:hypothetical protein [Modestobacter altitudinis]|uniref:hypothetical protein n=1 Tax=Modestobacter altitudinis TaxID=2213158 RepID=UPI0015D1F967|nr:hypothetical protein [Modestobacter altitudinis]
MLLSACAAEPAAPSTDPVSASTPPPAFTGPSGLERESEESARAALEAQRVAAEAAAAAAAAAEAEAQRQAETAAAAEAARASAAAEEVQAPLTEDECIGYGCSPEQDAEILEGERLANDDYGPGCGYQLCSEPSY